MRDLMRRLFDFYLHVFKDVLGMFVILAFLFYLWASFVQHNHFLTAHQTWMSINHFLNGCVR